MPSIPSLKKSLLSLCFFICVFATNISAQVNWMSWEEMIKAQEKEARPVFIDVYTDWCGWCKVMDRETFAKAEVYEVLNQDYYSVKFDAEQRGDIEVGDKTYSYVGQGRRGYHELAATILNGQLSYPTVVFLDEKSRVERAIANQNGVSTEEARKNIIMLGDLALVAPIPGYQKVEQLLPMLEHFGPKGNYINP